MDEDWRKAFGMVICTEICDGAGAGICDGVPSTCSSLHFVLVLRETSGKHTSTILTPPPPLKPHFYIVKMGLQGYTLSFSFLLKNTDCWDSSTQNQ